MPDAARGTEKTFPPYKQLTVETWPIDRLVEYARNPRKNDEQVSRMVGAIREFGFRIPIVAKSDGTVVDGHLRLKAARQLGLADVPVALADELTDAQIKAFRLLANKSASWAQWDDELLALELADLAGDGFDLGLTGFSAEELAALLDGPVGAGASASGGAGSLAERFGVPPFSVLNAREGWWQDRKRGWLALGIQSEIGRGESESDASFKSQGALRALQDGKPHRKANAIPGGAPMPLDRAKGRANATPGGSAMPAADYSKRQRGDGRGRAQT